MDTFLDQYFVLLTTWVFWDVVSCRIVNIVKYNELGRYISEMIWNKLELAF
jgi:hypothetical protein